MHNIEFLALIIGMSLIGTALLLPQRPRIDDKSRYYKLDKGSRE